MGDPKKQRKKYRKPMMIWNEEIIAEQKDLTQEYGLKNKKEIWKVESKLKSIHDQAKTLIAKDTEQSKKESEQLIKKLSGLSLIPSGSKLEDILSLTLKDFLNRRLQTLILQKGLSRTIKQARQFITHNHISIRDQVVNIPSYMVKASEESQIKFNHSSSLSQDEHPERVLEQEAKEKKAKEEIVEKPAETKQEEKSEKKVKTEPKKEEPEPETKKEKGERNIVSSKEEVENKTPDEPTPHKEK
ncbi:MAG: 30S ribosomal protein S4 [Nanoarchaeota archaeon]|jgi:small subunit ribosomal protein S4|nr:30S ribosomal protein S4 [Nanoarchaeota archaeon]|tara:strand:- start:39794 stop:40525 length:732 start_codon:yes stop_codon:yes gene_type:complete